MIKSKGSRRLFTLIFMLLFIPFAIGQGAKTVAAQAPESNPESIIVGIVNALNNGDVDGALALVGEEAVVVLMPPPPTGATYVGKEAIGAWWETFVGNHGSITITNFQSTGTMASWSATISEDTFTALGLESLAFEGVGIVHDGLLQSYTWIMTEESVGRLQAAVDLANNRALAQRYLEEMWDNGNMAVADELLADDFVDHYPLFGNAPDKAGIMADATNFHADGTKNRVEEMFVTPETIVIRDTVRMPDANGDLQDALEAAIFLTVKEGQITERRIAIFGLQPPPPPGANATPGNIAAEGAYMISGPPLERMTTPSGDGCLVNVVLPYTFNGAITGSAEVHLAVLGQGPCEEMGPGLFDETVAAKGAFTGTVDGKAGTFAFLYGFQGQAKQPFDGFIRIIPGSGTGELQGILGEFKATGNPLSGEPFVYVGNYAWAE
ncbi:MAG: nuclear transport factor 2 family protein [Caldilineaceae bacterium]